MTPQTDADAIVIGAGISGLAAAGELARRGWTVELLEARARIGGRIFSVEPKRWRASAELGAEFIHGGNVAVQKFLQKGKLRTRPVEATMWWRDQSSGVIAQIPDFWERVGRVVGQIPPAAGRLAFGQFLEQADTKISPADRYLSGQYVGSFEAAPIAQISAAVLREDHAGTDTNDRKIVGRYDRLVEILQQALLKKRVYLRLNAPVEAIYWRRGNVSVRGHEGAESAEFDATARAVLVTLPLGVLKAKRVKFFPSLPVKDRLIARMGWGHVVRVVLQFKRSLWSAPFMPRSLGASRGKNFGFVNAPGQLVPVWWALNAPAHYLCGWAGGDASKPLRGLPAMEVRKAAVRSLAVILGTTESRLERWLLDWQYHAWSTDPFSLGAYSFPSADCRNGSAELARPVSSTVFFAGEATAKDYGTVHGALESGLQAADEMDRALRRKSPAR